MKWLKWILAIVIAGIITIVPANLIMHRTGNVDMNNLSTFQYWVQFFAVPSLAFGLFLFLSCVFVSIQKKYAGLLVFILSIIFISMGAYQHYMDDGVLRNQYIVRYSGFVACLVIGFVLSYKLFRQNNWVSNGQKASR